MNRVVITGLGVVSPVGHNLKDYWDALIAGRSGLAPATLGESAKATGKLVGEVKDFDPSKHFDSYKLPLLDRVSKRRHRRSIFGDERRLRRFPDDHRGGAGRS